MREVVGVVVALVLPVLLGQALLRAAGLRPGTLWFWAWVWPLGALATALITFAWMGAGLDASTGLQAGPVAGAWIAIEVLLRRSRTRRASALEPRRTSASRLLVALVAALALGPSVDGALSQWGVPVFRDDDASIWTFKARILQEHGRIDRALAARMREDVTGAHHLDYPLFNPLCQVWVMGLGGGTTDWEVRLPGWMFLFSLVLLLIASCGRGPRGSVGLLVALVAATSPALFLPATGTKSDHWVAFGLLGVMASLERVREKDESAPWLLGAGALILVWSKNEGLMLALSIAAAGMALHGRHAFRWVRTRPWLLGVPLGAGGLVAVQIAFNRFFHLENDILSGGAGTDERSLARMLVENLPKRAGAIAHAFWVHVLDARWIQIAPRVDFMKPSNHGIYALLLGLIVVFPRRIFRSAAAWPALTSLFAIAGFFLAYTVSFEGRTPAGLRWHLFTSSSRVWMQILPCMALAAARWLGEMPLFWNSGEASPNGERTTNDTSEEKETPAHDDPRRRDSRTEEDLSGQDRSPEAH